MINEDVKEQISTGILKWVTPLIIVVVGFFLNRQIISVDNTIRELNIKIEKIEQSNFVNIQTVIRLEQRFFDLERRVQKIEN